MANFLEQLTAEWLEFNGFFVRRNLLVGKRERGGYECELDIVAFDPSTSKVLHVEPSTDASAWSEREKRYEKKFVAGRTHIAGLFPTFAIDPTAIDQVALLVFASPGTDRRLAGGRIVHVGSFMRKIRESLKKRPVASQAVPEQFGLLRSLQFAAQYWDAAGPPPTEGVL